MDGNHLAGWRLQSLGLWPPRFERPEEVVGWLGAVQSQDYGPAKWSLGARSRGVADAAVERAFADGAILRTHVLRPTWHFVLPEEIRWLLRLTAPRVHALNGYQYRTPSTTSCSSWAEAISRPRSTSAAVRLDHQRKSLAVAGPWLVK